MDEKPSEEAKPKVTRSRARHERRRRLISARKAAEKYPPAPTNETNVEADASNDSKSPVNRNGNEALSKSKARRLRKRNKTGESGEKNASAGSPSSEVSESIHKTVIEDSCTPIANTKINEELPPARSDVIDLNSLAKKSDAAKTTASEHELLENEKNLKITESSRASPTSPCKRVEALRDSRELIISKDSVTKSERETIVTTSESKVRSNGWGRVDASDEVSLTDSTKESCSIEVPKVCATSESTPSIGKMIAQEKTREQVKAEREAKKAAKAAAKSKGKVVMPPFHVKTVETPSVTNSSKKIVDETKGDVVDGEIIAMTAKPVITESKIKSDPVPIGTEAKTEVKSKSVMRAERRAKQEAQRAAKQDQLAEKNNVKTRNAKAPVQVVKVPLLSRCKIEQPTRKMSKRVVLAENAHEVSLFKHLYHEREQALIKVPTVNSTIHPAIIRLGVQYANKVIVGSNARCVALLAAVKQLIEDFERPPQADFTRGLEASLQESSAYLHHCRPIAVSMQNALRHLKWQMTQLPATTSDEEAKTKLGNAIDTYIQEQIQLADKAISITIQTKISNGDVILTYGYSSLICKILCDAYDTGRKFRVVVVDGRPWLEGREQLRRLAKHGLECSYVMINALSFIMPEVSKVFLGAHAILANGAVMSRVGTAQVALMAKAFNVPVLVACETHKTCERVQTDSIVYNEIANADELAQNLMGSSKKTSLINWRAKKSLNLLNLTYDVTPADLVTAVVTELAILPCTSVPVILRIKPSEI